jgi:hypothetical protein
MDSKIGGARRARDTLAYGPAADVTSVVDARSKLGEENEA